MFYEHSFPFLSRTLRLSSGGLKAKDTEEQKNSYNNVGLRAPLFPAIYSNLLLGKTYGFSLLLVGLLEPHVAVEGE